MKKLFFLTMTALCMLACDGNVPTIPDGTINAAFSVGEGKQVYFSQGNLQYHASTGTWRFAKQQYDMIGEDNANISSSYSGWIDLFGWGTGNNPVNVSEEDTDYAIFADWGVNSISNGGKQANRWRTLTEDEWEYLLEKRPDAEGKCGVAQVNGVNGLIFLPDDWTLPSGCSFTAGVATDYGSEYFATVNSYSASEWDRMESAGVLFLPAAGIRCGTSVYDVGSYGRYWSVTPNDENYAYCLSFDSSYEGMGYYGRYYGQPVRLVQDLP